MSGVRQPGGSEQHGRPGLAGRLLVALPGIGDPRFQRSVIALAHHDAEGAMGLCLHAELEGFDLARLFAELAIPCRTPPSSPVLLGGPVEPQRGFVLHSDDWLSETSLAVEGGLGLTATRDVLDAIASGQGPSRHIVALGYAGWGAGQLDQELRHHAWLVGEADEGLLFETPPAARWARALDAMGIDPAQLSGTGGSA